MAEDSLNDYTIPMILTQAHGGPYDTEAYKAGYHLASLDARLAMADAAGLICPPIVLKMEWAPQADLIAMTHGLTMQVQPIKEDPEYGFFIFVDPEMFDSTENTEEP